MQHDYLLSTCTGHYKTYLRVLLVLGAYLSTLITTGTVLNFFDLPTCGSSFDMSHLTNIFTVDLRDWVSVYVPLSPPKPLDQSKNVTVRTFHIWPGSVHGHMLHNS